MIMLITIDDFLNDAQLNKIHQVLEGADFVDGKLSAGMAAKKVKNNEEMALDQNRMEILYRILMSTLGANATFTSFALPNKVADFIFARYQSGMQYGDHVDDPIMGGGGVRFRSDVSMTIFLNSSDSYDGGELVIRTPFGDKEVKLDAGGAVIYPSASVHHVNEVTRGQRIVALTWVQSLVRDAAKRELLFEMDQAREHLLRTETTAEHTKRVDRSYANLLRMWADV